MRTDKLGYLWLQEIPEGFFALIGRDKADAQRYDFKSVELKETAFRIDGVFVPQETGDVLYFVEMQFQPDDAFYARFFAEISLRKFLFICGGSKWGVGVPLLSSQAAPLKRNLRTIFCNHNETTRKPLEKNAAGVLPAVVEFKCVAV